MYLVHFQVARPITTRNKQTYLKTWSTSLVTENTLKNKIIVFEPYSPGWHVATLSTTLSGNGENWQ